MSSPSKRRKSGRPTASAKRKKTAARRPRRRSAPRAREGVTYRAGPAGAALTTDAPRNQPPQFTFIDLFAGIGGTRIAFEEAGCRCVFSSEWDKFAQKTYEANFGEKPRGDIRAIPSNEIPDHDILVAGFPCQPFSISGVSKKNALGRPHGFNDPTQGTLFFEIKRILHDKRPRAFLLENVKNLIRHDKGRTYRVIMDALERDLGYAVYDRVIDAVDYVPQHRERIYIAGFRPARPFAFPVPPIGPRPRFADILEARVDQKYTLTPHLWRYLQEYARKHQQRGNGFGFGLTDPQGHSRTLSARYYKDGSEVLVRQNSRNPRRLTPSECARLMGFYQLRPGFTNPVSDTQAYKQFGNSVVVPLVAAIAGAIVRALTRRVENSNSTPEFAQAKARAADQLVLAMDRRSTGRTSQSR